MLAMLRRYLLALPRRQKIAIMVLSDLAFLPVALVGAFYLRLGNGALFQEYGIGAPVFMAMCTIPVFYACGLYRNVVRFVDFSMIKSIGIGLTILVLATATLTSLFTSTSLSRSSLLIYWFIAFAYVVVTRFGARSILRGPRVSRASKVPRVAIFGAGEAGFQLVNALRSSQVYAPVCFFDDDASLSDTHVAGTRVYRGDLLRETVVALKIDQVVVAIPSVPPETCRRILAQLRGLGVAVKTLPSLTELVAGRISVQSIREIKVEDLLGRQPVPPRHDLFSKCITGKSVLVTGAGGSIGSELCRQIVSQNPSHLVLLDHSEYALYAIERELLKLLPAARVSAYLGSVCDGTLLSQVIITHRVDTIYHAAAYKHVPIVESNMAEGIRNNVKGTLALAQAAARHLVETCVLVSTDKAVRPTNVMGATKRCAEMVFQAYAAQPDHVTNFSMVRFGNVLGSSGSVVPLFREQIRSGGPVTITHPDVTRYFMLIPEAAQLVIQAGAMSQGGDVFVLDMGEPVRIVDLARTMIEMSGLTEKTPANPHGDIEISVVGMRPGEKLYEELLIGDEVIDSEHPRIMCCHEQFLAWRDLEPMLRALFVACDEGDTLAIRIALQALVPEYAPYSVLSERPSTVQTEPVPEEGSSTPVLALPRRELLEAFE